MKHATVAIPEDVDEALMAYGRDCGVTGDLDALVEAALLDLLTGRGYLEPFRPFDIMPIHHDGEEADISLRHDQYFADWETNRPR